MTASALLEHPTETIAVPVVDPATTTNPRRGGDVRVFDRRDMREVGGPGHPFAATTDLLVTNGLVRFWVGTRGAVPYLNVAAWAGGVWRHVGCLVLAEAGSTSTLVAARLVSATTEKATVALSVRNLGTIAVRLHRGSRNIHISHGLLRRPTAYASRYVAWTGTPPSSTLVNVSVSTAAFGSGLDVGTNGAAIFDWPASVAGSAWGLSLWWRPNAPSSTLADAGLAALLDSTGAVLASLQWFAADKTLRWTIGATVLSSAPLTFAATEIVNVQMRLGVSGRTLTTKVDSGAVAHVRDGVSSLGGTVASISLGQVGAVVITRTYGLGQFGAGSYGLGSVSGGAGSRGPIDNVMVFSDALTDTEAGVLASATTALGSLPQPEARLAWFAPFDQAPVTAGSVLASGGAVIFETTTEGGTTQAAYQGLSRALCTYHVAEKLTGVAMRRTDISWSVIAAIGTTAPGDTVTDNLVQANAASEQETTVR